MSDSLKEFCAGTVGGFAGKLLDYPLDTVKVLLQTQASNSTTRRQPLVYRGAWDCLLTTFNAKGIRGLYKGLSSPLLGSMAENAVLFVSYGAFQKILSQQPQNQQPLSLYQLALAGAGAGGVVSFVLTPVELVKCRLQVQSSASHGFRPYKGPMDVVLQTFKSEGLVGFYRGQASTMLREVPGNFCWYGVYEGVCAMFIPEGGTKSDLGPSAHIVGGAMAGIAYWTAFYPADTIKSHVQTTSTNKFWTVFSNVLKSQGWRGLYRGWGITVARAAPAHAAIFATYEYTLKLLRPSVLDPDTNFTMHESIKD